MTHPASSGAPADSRLIAQAQAVVLFAHGSRDPQWHRPIQAVSERLQAQHPALLVRAAYLELTTPDLPTVVEGLLAQGVQRVRVVPLFLGVGRHAREDLPALVEALRLRHPSLLLDLAPAVGEDERLLDLLAELAWPTSTGPEGTPL